jgi:hypothetical protein
MDLLNLIDKIDQADPEFQDRISPRRDAIKNITSFGSKVAVAAMPVFFATLLKKAYGQTLTTSVASTLNFALKLEFLEAAFYNAGIASATIQGQLSATEKSYITSIAAHENAHVKFLQSVLGSSAIAQSSQGANGAYDFTGGFNTTTNTVTNAGPFATVFTNSATFLTVACAFEDTGVRAYKGAAPSLVGQQVYLTAALDIHSVEARHASAIRQLLFARGITIKPWITGANDTGVSAVNGNYAGEDATVQAGVTITNLNGVNGTISTSAATEAFDQPLDSTTVAGLVSIFGVK